MYDEELWRKLKLKKRILNFLQCRLNVQEISEGRMFSHLCLPEHYAPWKKSGRFWLFKAYGVQYRIVKSLNGSPFQSKWALQYVSHGVIICYADRAKELVELCEKHFSILGK